MIERTDVPDSLPLPANWAHAEIAELAEVVDAAAALRSGRPQAWLAEHDDQSPCGFGPKFWSLLSGTRGHVVLEVPSQMTSAGAATLVAAWMGLRPEEVHDDIGGIVSRVISGVGHRHDQSWHTDSTPWYEPNRYSILGLLEGGGSGDLPTNLLALTSLKEGLAGDPKARAALRTESISWRRNFPHLVDLRAPVFGTPHLRWVWPVLDDLRDEMSADLQRGVTLVARLINEVPFHSPVVDRSHLLVFDNRRMLHRGPRLEASSGRALIRIKVVGEAIA